MTREEAKIMRYGYEPFTYEDVDVIVDRIYDDFENRSCEDCKYCELSLNGTVFRCYNEKSMAFRIILSDDDGIYQDFSCNKWESKNESKTKR